jgi:hypothetical protein
VLRFDEPVPRGDRLVQQLAVHGVYPNRQEFYVKTGRQLSGARRAASPYVDLRHEFPVGGAGTTAIYTTVGQDARNRMLRAALARAFGEGGQG